MTKERNQSLATRVRKFRNDRAWSQEHLAGAANLSLRTVQRVENGRGGSPETLQALASALEGNSAALFNPLKERQQKNGFVLGKPQAIFLGALILGLLWLLWTYGHLHFLKHWFE